MKRAEWERYRTWTLANCSFGAFSFGLSLTIYYPTEYYYFKDTMKVANPAVFYGLSWAFLCSSGIISSLVGSYYADKTKNVREIFLSTCLVNVIGNIMYLLYYSPYVVLCGQFLIGMAAARMVAAVGEITRIYETDQLTSKVSFLGIFTTLGSIIGPSTTYLFDLVNTRVGNWKLNVGNMVGLVMGGIYFVQFWVHYFSLMNLSKEFNLKKELTAALVQVKEEVDKIPDDEGEEDETKYDFFDGDLSEDDEVRYRKPSQADDLSHQSDQKEELVVHQERKDSTDLGEAYLVALRAILSNKNVLFLYSMSFFCSYCRATIILLSPIKATLYLGWTQTDLAGLNILSTFFGAIPTAIALSTLSKFIQDLYLLAFTVITLLLALIFMAIIPFVYDSHLMITVLLYANGVLILSSTAGFHIMSRCMLAKFVPENVQTVTEAIRNSLFEFSYLIAGVCIKLPDAYMAEFMIAVSFIMVLALSWLLVQGDEFKNIQVIQVD